TSSATPLARASSRTTRVGGRRLFSTYPVRVNSVGRCAGCGASCAEVGTLWRPCPTYSAAQERARPLLILHRREEHINAPSWFVPDTHRHRRRRPHRGPHAKHRRPGEDIDGQLHVRG